MTVGMSHYLAVSQLPYLEPGGNDSTPHTFQKPVPGEARHGPGTQNRLPKRQPARLHPTVHRQPHPALTEQPGREGVVEGTLS